VSEDFYAILGVSRGASTREIRAAFRRLARVHHPDLGSSAPDEMVRVNRAYAVLSDPERRRVYDAEGASGVRAAEPMSESELTLEDPPWLIDLERGHDLEDWRQMYAEERQVWEHLLQSRDPPDPAIQQALERAEREQLRLENAIRHRHGLQPLELADLDDRLSARSKQRSAEATRVGCAALILVPVLASYLSWKSSSKRRGSGTTTWRP
jgi:curved DNA-binding protein CbpA